MLAIDREAEIIRRQREWISRLYWLIIALGLIIIILAVMIFAMTQTAAATEICLTKKQARQLWPRDHLYWFSKDHCWSNRRGPPRNLKMDPVINSKALAQATKKQDKLKHNTPEKVVSAPLDSRAPLKIEKDFCCWPDLQQLEREVTEMHWKRLRGWLEYKP